MGETKIFVVMGQTGEYSDHTSWPVAAYRERVLADRHADADAATARALTLHEAEDEDGNKRRFSLDGEAWVKAQMGNLDPGIRMDYTGTDYYVLEAPVLDAVPE